MRWIDRKMEAGMSSGNLKGTNNNQQFKVINQYKNKI